MKYVHVKTGGLYEVLDEGTDEKTEETVVIYKSLDNDIVWVRSASEFYDGRFRQINPVVDEKTEYEVWRYPVEGCRESCAKNYPARRESVTPNKPSLLEYPEIADTHEYRLYKVESKTTLLSTFTGGLDGIEHH